MLKKFIAFLLFLVFTGVTEFKCANFTPPADRLEQMEQVLENELSRYITMGYQLDAIEASFQEAKKEIKNDVKTLLFQKLHAKMMAEIRKQARQKAVDFAAKESDQIKVNMAMRAMEDGDYKVLERIFSNERLVVGEEKLILPERVRQAAGYPAVFTHAAPPRWSNYGPCYKGAERDWTHFSKVLRTLNDKKFAYACCLNWVDWQKNNITNTGNIVSSKIEKELRTTSIQALFYTSMKAWGWIDNNPDKRMMDYQGKVCTNNACMNSSAYIAAKRAQVGESIEAGADGICFEEIFLPASCYCNTCVELFTSQYGRKPLYDPFAGEYIFTDKDYVNFRVKAVNKILEGLKAETAANDKILAAYVMIYRDMPGLSFLGGNDLAEQLDIVDILLPECYYQRRCASPFNMFMLGAMARGEHRGRMQPVYDMYYLDTTTPYNVKRGIIYALLSGVNDCGLYIYTGANWEEAFWPAQENGMALFQWAYPGSIEVTMPRTALMKNTLKSKFGMSVYDPEIRGIYNTLNAQGIPVEIVADVDMEKLSGKELAARFDVLCLPDLLFASDRLCSNLEEANRLGAGLIATGKTGIFDEVGRLSDRRRLPWLADYSGEDLVDRYSIARTNLTTVVLDRWNIEDEPEVKTMSWRYSKHNGNPVVLKLFKEGGHALVNANNLEGKVLPYVKSYTNGIGRSVVFAGYPGRHIQKYFFDLLGKANLGRNYSDDITALEIAMLPSIYKWTAGVNNLEEIIDRGPVAEIYKVKKGQEKILIIMNSDKRSTSIKIKKISLGEVWHDFNSGAKIRFGKDDVAQIIVPPRECVMLIRKEAGK